MFGTHKCAGCGTPSHVGEDEDFQCRKCGCVTLEVIRDEVDLPSTPRSTT